MIALRRCNALRNAALLALRQYVDTMPQAPLLRCFNHFFSPSRGPLLPARIVLDEKTGHRIFHFFAVTSWKITDLSSFTKNRFFHVTHTENHRFCPFFLSGGRSAVRPFAGVRSNFGHFCRHFGKFQLVGPRLQEGPSGCEWATSIFENRQKMTEFNGIFGDF